MAEYTTGYQQDIFYVVNSTVGDLNNIYSFLVSNPGFYLNRVPVNATFNYEAVVDAPAVVASAAPPSLNVAYSYNSSYGQTIFDVTLMTSTDLNQVFKLMVDSGFENVNTLPKANTTFIFDNINDNILSNFLKNNGVVFNTGQNITSAGNLLLLQNGAYLLLEDGISKIIL